MEIIKSDKKNISTVIEMLNRGGVVICPTDTVYGFLALAENKKAVEKIFKIKKRLKSKTLPIFVNSIKMAKEIAEVSLGQEKVLKSKWPGKYTFVLKSKVKSQKSKFCKFVVAENGTVALRIPKYKFLNDLLKKINKPLAQTSVNISEQPALTKIEDMVKQFGKKDILIIDGGNLNKCKPSKIIDLTSEERKIIRK